MQTKHSVQVLHQPLIIQVKYSVHVLHQPLVIQTNHHVNILHQSVMQTKHSVQVLHQPVSESFKPATPKYTTNTSKDNNANNELSPNIRCNQPTAASTPNNWM